MNSIRESEAGYNFEEEMEKIRKNGLKDKIGVIYYGNREESEEPYSNEFVKYPFHCFILSGSKELNPFEIEHLLDEANDLLIDKYQVSAESCITYVSNEMRELTGYGYAFEQGIWITERTSKLLLAADTGDCALEEAIAIWLMMQLGEYLEDYEQVKSHFEQCCRDINKILSSSSVCKEQ
jgi:hypothetical protein